MSRPMFDMTVHPLQRFARKFSIPSVATAICLLALCQFACDNNDQTPKRERVAIQDASDASSTTQPAGVDAKSPVVNQEPPVDSRPGPAGQQGLNIIALSPQIISGAVPEQPTDFAMLSNHGVKTIISVDGAQPDLESAKRFGMRYVHLPIGYHGIDRDRQLEIARAVRDLPGPVYVHCHHGKHRGPAAAASAAVLLGIFTPERAIGFMRHAGTSDSYAGLYECVTTLKPDDDADIDTAPTDFPETAPVPGFVKAMSEVSHAYDHLKEIRTANWQAPAHHPDLVPLAEAGRLENLLRALREDKEYEKYPPDFMQLMEASWSASVEFEKILTANKPHEELSAALNRVGQSCTACHTPYRNQK